MKLTVRPMTFETNSSSTHSLVFCTPEQYERFQTGNLLYIDYDYGDIKRGSLVTEKEIMDEIAKRNDSAGSNEPETDEEVLERLLEWGEIKRFSDYGRDLEFYMDKWTTPGGEEVVVFGEYGHD